VVTATVEIILGILFVMVLMQLFKKKPPEPRFPQPDLANLKASDARTGDAISIAGAGDSMSDLDFTVERTTWVQAGSRRSLELSGHYRERRVTLRVANIEEEMTVALNDGSRKVTLDDLGVSENDLGEIDERQNPSDNFEYDDKVWMYRLSREAQTSTDGGAPPASFYYWEFEEQGGKELVTIRKGEGEPFAVSRFNVIPPTDVTVYRRV
jgi:hypothetical protein